MRRFLILCVLGGFAVGCRQDAEQAGDLDGDSTDSGDGFDGNDSGTEPGACATADDCVVVSASCCGCPDLAVLATSNAAGELAAACDEVECPEPPPGACAPVEVRCEDTACVLGCPSTVCELTCDAGFALDPGTGCQVCACADPALQECLVDDDCAQVPADCCGCGAGGADTAVPASDAAAAIDALGCDGSEACPGLDVCDPQLGPRCLSGSCQLAPGDRAAPPGCGAADAGCPIGMVCVIGDDADGNGLGECQLPPP